MSLTRICHMSSDPAELFNCNSEKEWERQGGWKSVFFTPELREWSGIVIAPWKIPAEGREGARREITRVFPQSGPTTSPNFPWCVRNEQPDIWSCFISHAHYHYDPMIMQGHGLLVARQKLQHWSKQVSMDRSKWKITEDQNDQWQWRNNVGMVELSARAFLTK